MFEKHIQLIDAAFKRAEEIKGRQYLAEHFFELFFHNYPQTKKFFKTTDFHTYAPMKYRMITEFLLDTVKHPDFAEGELTDEVRRHQAFGLHHKEHFYALVDTLEVLISEVLADEWTEELAGCWIDVSQAMKNIITEATSYVYE
ncbi:MAG: hypothetical protein HRU20_01970 [Pseudomonadales bacterium]|nr:hypothetical protein [Pseudomonadales bacterium]